MRFFSTPVGSPASAQANGGLEGCHFTLLSFEEKLDVPVSITNSSSVYGYGNVLGRINPIWGRNQRMHKHLGEMVAEVLAV